MKTKKGDFVEIKFVGRLEDNTIFDLNDKELAKKENIQAHIHDKTIICLGFKDVVQGLDDFLIDKEENKKLEITIQPELGFGKRDAKYFSMIPLNKFKDQKFAPMPGLRIEVDGTPGTIKSVSGGRVLVDFNHPLAGHTLKYEVTIQRIVSDLKEKVSSLLETNLHMHKNYQIEETNGEIIIKSDLPQELKEMLEAELKKRIPELKELKLVKK
jgi:FKBP-type peptidyl-prolyl cis-trans isomerase SlyD